MKDFKTFIKEITEAIEYIEEESVSKAQQRFMGTVHAVQEGDIEPPSEEIENVAKSMKKKDVKKFAKTKHKGLPEKKN